MSDINGHVTMTVPPRVDPPMAADERTMLTTWLDWHRATVLLKCAGLAPEEETARHNGHLGLLRELADGVTGE